jgi:inhibitor of KinA
MVVTPVEGPAFHKMEFEDEDEIVPMPNDMAIFSPLGDQAILVYLPDESAASRFAAAARAASHRGWLDIVQAYSSVAVHFDPDLATWSEVRRELEMLNAAPAIEREPRSHLIPCCYELGPDLERVAHHLGIAAERVVRLHCEVDYTAFAVGFCPGFAFLGYLQPELSGMPRLPAPRKKVEPGSVGLTGRQTGVYPLERPGGWNLVGKTPLVLVDVAAGFFPIGVGDRVRFEPINRRQYEAFQGHKLGAVEL